jgi:pantoate--beta-alanine ligase
MKRFISIAAAKAALAAARVGRRTVGFVPTMGYLHDGHLSLVRECRKRAAVTVVSVFVNPLQFGPQEDFRRYPRDPERDAALLEKEGVDILFIPETAEMYPPAFRTSVEVSGLQDKLCGRSRPGHFRGVATVVLKLLNIVRPDYAFLGQKDAQQVVILRRMAEDLNLDVQIVALPIVREPDGLAMSSRNVYLSVEEPPRSFSGAFGRPGGFLRRGSGRRPGFGDAWWRSWPRSPWPGSTMPRWSTPAHSSRSSGSRTKRSSPWPSISDGRG